MKSQEQMNVSPNYMTYNGNHLFHFTSFSSSIRIISSNCLIFGDFKNMNDISESRREIFDKTASNYSAPPMGMSNRLTVVLQQELH